MIITAHPPPPASSSSSQQQIVDASQLPSSASSLYSPSSFVPQNLSDKVSSLFSLTAPLTASSASSLSSASSTASSAFIGSPSPSSASSPLEAAELDDEDDERDDEEERSRGRSSSDRPQHQQHFWPIRQQQQRASRPRRQSGGGDEPHTPVAATVAPTSSSSFSSSSLPTAGSQHVPSASKAGIKGVTDSSSLHADVSSGLSAAHALSSSSSIFNSHSASSSSSAAATASSSSVFSSSHAPARGSRRDAAAAAAAPQSGIVRDAEEVRASSSSSSSTSSSVSSASSASSAARVDNTRITPAELHGRYRLVRYLGSGSYGHVHVATDVSTGASVAIKKIVNIFDNLTNAKRLLREVKILRMLNQANVIRLLEILPPVQPACFDDLLIVFEFVETDLQKLIHSDQPFTNDHVQYFLYQLLCGVRYIHSAHIIHRDLKPANVLVNSDCSLKICDFGLARSTGGAPDLCQTPLPQQSTLSAAVSASSASSASSSSCLTASGGSKPPLSKRTSVNSGASAAGLAPATRLTRELTKHVVTRWYRAPELILLSDRYSTAIDMWSVGCILAELLSMQTQSFKQRMPLFPGKSCFPFSADNPLAYTDQLDQLNVIFDVLGTPSSADISRIDNDKARNYLRGLQHKPHIDFVQRFPGADLRAIDLLQQLLTFDPDRRWTAEQALQHPYLSELRLEAEERLYDAQQPHKLTDFAFEDVKGATKDDMRQLIVQEILIDSPAMTPAMFRQDDRQQQRPAQHDAKRDRERKQQQQQQQQQQERHQAAAADDDTSSSFPAGSSSSGGGAKRTRAAATAGSDARERAAADSQHSATQRRKMA